MKNRRKSDRRKSTMTDYINLFFTMFFACIIIAMIVLWSQLQTNITTQNALLTEYELYIADIYAEKENCINQMGVFYDGSLYSKNK